MCFVFWKGIYRQDISIPFHIPTEHPWHDEPASNTFPPAILSSAATLGGKRWFRCCWVGLLKKTCHQSAIYLLEVVLFTSYTWFLNLIKALASCLKKGGVFFFCRKLSLGSRKKRPKKNGRDRKNGVFNDRVHDRKNLISWVLNLWIWIWYDMILSMILYSKVICLVFQIWRIPEFLRNPHSKSQNRLGRGR